MSSKVKLIKRPKSDELLQVAVQDSVKNEQQRNREMVSTIKSWIDEFKLRSTANKQTALALLVK